MGYYTKYDLEYEGGNISEHDIIDALATINPGYFEKGDDFCWVFEEEMKWYDCEHDMLELSKLFPDVMFTLYGAGEDREDNWIDYFKAGQMQSCHGTIVYEPFNPKLFETGGSENG